ncbi:MULTISPECIES: ribose 5-phosphate isomerase B [Staphylococcus]|jgi:ribose 5-phosphate isomerase B|uniref:ribose 5-phosphate isomerase B n=1 Tax=Staphylococcus TaxID=1279 RepID=UPI000E685258|nr:MULTISPECIES: ribose 5-phosphate isomerase B [Staphylococcus]MDW8552855.1 ribose 5-phosphate isomerase B [Staphylococcus nepalensis]RIO41500.1 ribose 5-phosphate isomerase B [Staphylococcus nepalensis]WQL20280.1 ribose 5-phosphate isomerase B [Staphylococcus nepalensis]
MKIAIGNDHVGFELKPAIKTYLKELGHEVIDIGTNSSERTNYPDYGKQVATSVVEKKADLGILICGTGIGISIAANKVSGIRAVVCSEPYTAKLSREHNNTNILAFGSRVIGSELAKMIVKEWLEAKFEGGRHQDRIDSISEIENKYLC